MKIACKSAPFPRGSFWLASVVTACLVPFGPSSLRAQTADTWNGGAGNWSNAARWSTGSVPDGAGFDVSIDGGKTGTASVVTLDNSYTVGRLSVDVGDTLSLTNFLYVTDSGGFAGARRDHFA